MNKINFWKNIKHCTRFKISQLVNVLVAFLKREFFFWCDLWSINYQLYVSLKLQVLNLKFKFLQVCCPGLSYHPFLSIILFVFLNLCVPHVCQNLIYSFLLKNIFLHNKAFLINLFTAASVQFVWKVFSSKIALTILQQKFILHTKVSKYSFLKTIFKEKEVSDENHLWVCRNWSKYEWALLQLFLIYNLASFFC